MVCSKSKSQTERLIWAPQIVAVISVYNPDLTTFKQNFKWLREANVRGIVINDGSVFSTSEYEHFTSTLRSLSFDLINHDANLGLAASLNTGIDRALSLGANYVILFDQDSLVSQNLVPRMLSAYEALKNIRKNISAIGPTHVDVKAGIISDFFRSEPIDSADDITLDHHRFTRCDFLITSGCLIHRSALESVGLMDESLFIDAVDFEWFFRARSLGFEAYGVRNVTLTHDMGDSSFRYWLFRWRHIPRHSPFRYYYIYRNSILLWKRPYVPRDWIKTDFKRLYKTAIIFAIFVPGRINNLKMMMRGVLDGIRGKSGKIPI